MKAIRLFLFVNLMFFGAANVWGQNCCASLKNAEIKTEKNMNIKLEKFAFDVPAELEDLTVYTFGSEDGETSLRVFYSKAMQNMRDSQSSAGDFIKESKSAMGEAFRVESETDTVIANLPAREVKYTIAREDGKLTRWILADAYDKSNGYVIRMLYTKENGGAAETSAEFEQMRNSAVRTGTSVEKPIPGGYRRQFAGAITLAVKDSVYPPQSFEFGSDSGRSQPYLQLSFYIDSKKISSFEEEKASDEKSLGKLDGEVTSTPFKNGTTEGTGFSYSLIKKPYPDTVEKFAVRRAHLKLSNGVEIHLYGWSEAKIEPDLNRYFAGILNSIIQTEAKK